MAAKWLLILGWIGVMFVAAQLGLTGDASAAPRRAGAGGAENAERNRPFDPPAAREDTATRAAAPRATQPLPSAPRFQAGLSKATPEAVRAEPQRAGARFAGPANSGPRAVEAPTLPRSIRSPSPAAASRRAEPSLNAIAQPPVLGRSAGSAPARTPEATGDSLRRFDGPRLEGARAAGFAANTSNAAALPSEPASRWALAASPRRAPEGGAAENRSRGGGGDAAASPRTPRAVPELPRSPRAVIEDRRLPAPSAPNEPNAEPRAFERRENMPRLPSTPAGAAGRAADPGSPNMAPLPSLRRGAEAAPGSPSGRNAAGAGASANPTNQANPAGAGATPRDAAGAGGGPRGPAVADRFRGLRDGAAPALPRSSPESGPAGGAAGDHEAGRLRERLLGGRSGQPAASSGEPRGDRTATEGNPVGRPREAGPGRSGSPGAAAQNPGANAEPALPAGRRTNNEPPAIGQVPDEPPVPGRAPGETPRALREGPAGGRGNEPGSAGPVESPRLLGPRAGGATEVGPAGPDSGAARLRDRLLGGRDESPSRNDSNEGAAGPAGRGTPGHPELILRGPREGEGKPENGALDRQRLPTPLRGGDDGGPREPLGGREDRGVVERGMHRDLGSPDAPTSPPSEGNAGLIDRGLRGNRGPHGESMPGTDRAPQNDRAPGEVRPTPADRTPGEDRPLGAERRLGADRGLGGPRGPDADRKPGMDRIPGIDRNLGDNREPRSDDPLRGGDRGPGPRGPSSDVGRMGPKGEHERLGPNFEPGRGGPRGELGRAGGEQRFAGPPSKFAQRVESGELHKVVRGETAAKLRLEEQYRLAAHGGDYARRLELYKNVDRITQINKTTNITNITNVTNINSTNVNVHVGGRPYYYGRVAPHYHRDCFQWNYWGHSFFAGVCWYPRWTPWVRWSWYFTCEPVWDPRPIWCRPIVYAPAPVWVYYPVPVWQPLPECESGTWVDVAKVEVGPRPDIQLLAVRLVDPGHPEEKLGPRYRVWIRNNGDVDIDRPFNVVALTSLDGRPAAELPQAGIRVEAIRAGETQSFDIRLPVECYAMGRDADGKPVAFATLHVIADADREITNEATRTNNGANIARDKIFPVDPAVFGVDPKETVEGGEVVIAGEGLGPQPGQVLVNVDGAETEAEILGWFDLGVRVALPKLPAGAGRREVQLIVIRGDGAAANPIGVVVAPAEGAAALPRPAALQAVEPQGPARIEPPAAAEPLPGPVFPQ